MQTLVALQWEGNNQTDLGAGVLPMNMVPPGAVSAAGRSSTLSTAQNSQNINHMMSAEGSIAMADAIALGKVQGMSRCTFRKPNNRS